MKKRILLLVMFSVCVLASCNTAFKNDLTTFNSNFEEINALKSEYNNAIESLDLAQFENDLNDDSLEIEQLETIRFSLENEVVPTSEQLSNKVDSFSVNNSRLNELHSDLKESVSLRSQFANDLLNYVQLTQNLKQIDESLINQSQSLIESLEKRHDVVESAEEDDEVQEIETLIEIINENSDELESETELQQGDVPYEEKENHLDEVLTPLIDTHIQRLNELNLETHKAIKVRSLTLEMYYGYQQYYKERKNSLQYSEQLSNLQLSEIMRYKNSYEKLDEQIQTNLEKINREA